MLEAMPMSMPMFDSMLMFEFLPEFLPESASWIVCVSLTERRSSGWPLKESFVWRSWSSAFRKGVYQVMSLWLPHASGLTWRTWLDYSSQNAQHESHRQPAVDCLCHIWLTQFLVIWFQFCFCFIYIYIQELHCEYNFHLWLHPASSPCSHMWCLTLYTT